MSESGDGIRDGVAAGGRVARGRAWVRYGAALGSVAAAALLTYWLYASGIGFALPFAVFFGAVAVAAMVGGRAPGFLAVALSAVVGNFLFVPPLSAPSLDTSGLLQTLVFALVASFIVELTVRRQRAEAEARASGRWLSTTLRSIGDAVIATDHAGRVRFMNPEAQKLTGWGEAEARGRPLAEVFPIVNEETNEPAESPAARVIREGVVVGLANHTVLLSKDGRRVPIDDSAAPIRGEAGATVGVVMVFHDITERRRAERALGESEARFRAMAEERSRIAAIVESSEDAIIGKTLEGVITSWNRGAERVYGYTAEEAVGRHITFIVPPERRDEVESFLDEIRRGRKVEHREAVRVRKDGALLSVSVTISPVKDGDGRIVGASTIARDVTERQRAEEALRESERRYRHLADSMPQIVWTARADGYTDYFNRRWYEYTGRAPEETEGWGWQQVIHPDDVERCVRRWARSVETGEDFEVEYRFRRGSDGAYRWHLGRAGAQRDGAGRVLRWYGTSTDIDDQKRTEETLRFLAEAEAVLAASLDFERTLESVARLAVPRLADFCLVDMADGAGPVRRMVVAHSDPEKEARWREMQRRTPLDPEAAAAVPKVLRTGRPELYTELTDGMFGGDGDANGRGQLGALREFGVGSAMVVPLLARGRTIGALSFISAESGRRYTERDLATASDLARRAALAIDNAQLYRRTEEANRTKDEFLATLSHELRTPLTPIAGWVHMLRSGRVGAAELPHGLDVIERNSQALARLINDLLDMSAIMSGKMRIERAPVRLNAVIEEAVEAARAEAERRRTNVALEVEPCDGDGGGFVVSGDRTRLLQVFANLLNNAVKFSAGDATVRVRCRHDGARAHVEIADEGYGIAPEFLPHVFERFRQADSSTTRRHGGLGLGLALVKSFVEAHGGEVRAESEGEGRGSRFTVALPLLRLEAPPPAARDRQAAAEPAKPRGPRVLVVEDARDTLEMLEAVFASRGFEVTLCETADEALGVASSGGFDIIISDIGLPNTDGYELMRRLRGLAAMRDVPAVALTGYAAQKDKDAALSSGFDLHIAKPVDPVALADAVEQLLRRKPPET